MPVAGYNVIPDENDFGPIIEVIQPQDQEETATISIGQEYSEERVKLNLDELYSVQRQVGEAIQKIRWNTAQWVYADTSIRAITHLQRNGEHGKEERALCGAEPPRHLTWHLYPVEGEPFTTHLCKKCAAIAQKRKQTQN